MLWDSTHTAPPRILCSHPTITVGHYHELMRVSAKHEYLFTACRAEADRASAQDQLTRVSLLAGWRRVVRPLSGWGSVRSRSIRSISPTSSSRSRRLGWSAGRMRSTGRGSHSATRRASLQTLACGAQGRLVLPPPIPIPTRSHQIPPLRSNYGPTMTRRVHAFLAARGIPLASNQINYSLMYRKANEDTIAVCAELGNQSRNRTPPIPMGNQSRNRTPPIPQSGCPCDPFALLD